MSWSRLYEYIISVAPCTFQGLLGVPEEHILACENGLNLRLPTAYREFLLTMGVDAGGLYPLGGTMEWNFYEILRDLPAEGYSPQEFFRIATEPDDSLDIANDLYLDMRTVDESGDCEVLMLEWAVPPRRENALPPRRTFLEVVARQAWALLDAARFSHSRIVFVAPEIQEEVAVRKAAIVEVLQRAGFHHTLPVLGRLECFSLDGGEHVGTARVDQDEHGLVAYVASDSEALVSTLAQLLLDNIEGAHVSERFPSLESLSR